MSTCRSCGAKIEWKTLQSGKNHPVDPDLVSVEDCEKGDKLVLEDGKVLVVTAEDERDIEGYVSHFSTCPDADKWRKSK